MADDDKKTKEQQLAEIQGKLAEIEKRRRARTQVDDVATATAELERAELIDSFEADHGPVGRGIAVFEVPDGSIVVVKKPASATYRKFVDSKSQSSEAAAAFVKPCVVYPAKERWVELLDEYPAILARVALGCARLAGHRDDEKP